MTNRIKGLEVALECDIREDDCQQLIDAILMIKGVASVKTNVSNHNDFYIKQQLKRELYKGFHDKIAELLD
jgi:uncharacterized protein (UPF0264 family)